MILNRTFVCYNKTAYEKIPTPWDATGRHLDAYLDGPSLHTEGYGHSLIDSRILRVSPHCFQINSKLLCYHGSGDLFVQKGF